MFMKMRLLCVSFLAGKLIVSTALMTGDLLEAPSQDSGLLPYEIAANIEGTRCSVVAVKILCWCLKSRTHLCGTDRFYILRDSASP